MLDYVYDEGAKVEPKYYLPIIPTILVNGCKAGIGTGWSTSIPSYNPKDLINYIISYLNDSDLPSFDPWYKGFNGTIKKTNKFTYESEGIYTRNDKKITITELPIMTWTDKYKEFLETLLENKKIKGFKNYSSPNKVHFEIVEGDMKLCKTNLKLVSTISTSNMVLFTDNNKLQKFKTIYDILDCFITKRYGLYVKRKEFMINNLEKELTKLKTTYSFISLVVNDKIVIFKNSYDNIINQLNKYDFKLVDGSYEYLLSINISKFSESELVKLENNIKDVKKELEIVRNTSENDMWISELKELDKLL